VGVTNKKRRNEFYFGVPIKLKSLKN